MEPWMVKAAIALTVAFVVLAVLVALAMREQMPLVSRSIEFVCILGHGWTGDEDDEWTDGKPTLPVCPRCGSDGARA